MLKRIITGLSLIAYVLLLSIGGIYEPICIDILILSFAIVGTYEVFTVFKKSGYRPSAVALIFALIAVCPLRYYYGIVGVISVLLISFIIAMTIFVFNKSNIKDLMASMFCIIYPIFFISTTFMMFSKIDPVFLVLMAVFIPVGADVFAYFVGSTFKGPKLCPSISPKKTISGAIGGLIGGVVASMLLFVVFEVLGVAENLLIIPVFHDDLVIAGVLYGVIGILGALVSIIGDLFASRVKREMGIKDFGNIFPGHGGVLDRIDSILYEVVFFFVAFMFMGIL